MFTTVSDELVDKLIELYKPSLKPCKGSFSVGNPKVFLQGTLARNDYLPEKILAEIDKLREDSSRYDFLREQPKFYMTFQKCFQ